MAPIRWRSRRLIGLALAAILAGGCASSDVPAIGAPGQVWVPTDEERALWVRAEQEQARLLERAPRYAQAPLVEYLIRIGDRLMPDSARAAGGPMVRFVVLADPTLNAFSLPDGRVFVHTGLLAALANEAQLATILAREIAHVTGRHALEASRQARHDERVASVVKIASSIAGTVPSPRGPGEDHVGTAVLSPTANAVFGLQLSLIATASIAGYGAERERETDAEALLRLAEAGYEPREAIRLFRRLRDEAGSRGPVERFSMGNPARLDERYRATSEFVKYRHAEESPAAVRSTAEFEERLRPVARDNAMLDIQAGRFALAASQLERVLGVTPDDAVARLYRGELHRLQAQRTGGASRAAHVRRAREEYEQAIALDPALAEPHRALGLLFYQDRDRTRARESFQRYLALQPDAADAPRIRQYVDELSR